MKRLLMPSVALAAIVAAQPAAVFGSVRNDANPGKIEALLNDVKSEMGRITDEVKRTAEAALSQTKDTGKTTDELKNKADELLVVQGKLTDAQTKLEGRLEGLESRNTELEQLLAGRGGGSLAPQLSLGQEVANSELLANYNSNGQKGSLRIPIQNAITSVPASAGALIQSDRETQIVGMPKRKFTIRELLTPGSTGSNLVEYSRQITRTNAAEMVAEGGAKPESDYAWEPAEAAVRTIAHYVKVSRQALDDANQLQTEIDGELRYGLDLKEEAQLLAGDGTGQNLSGLITEATAYVAAFAVTAETMIDQLRLSILQASLAEYPATGLVMNPTDWTRIELSKDGENRYIIANATQTTGPMLWGRPVVETQAVAIDEFVTGAFRAAATIYDRMGAEVVISSEDGDNFTTNMYTVRAEKRLALAIKRSAALVHGDFGNVA